MCKALKRRKDLNKGDNIMGFGTDLISGIAMSLRKSSGVLRGVQKRGFQIKQLGEVAKMYGRSMVGLDTSIAMGGLNKPRFNDMFMNHFERSAGGLNIEDLMGAKHQFRIGTGMAKEMAGNWWSGKSLTGASHPHMAQRAALRHAAVYGGGIAVGANLIFGGHRRRR